MNVPALTPFNLTDNGYLTVTRGATFSDASAAKAPRQGNTRG
jgi:hypothetical protein